MENVMAVVLAAGEGKRMKSKRAKVTHKACGKALIKWVIDAVDKAGLKECIVVIGHQWEQVKECLGDKVHYVHQDKQLGTGHAVMQAEEHFRGKDGHVIILYGDTPLISSETISKTIEYHIENGNAATVVTALLDDPAGYGRIVRDDEGSVLRIVEHQDATDEEKCIHEVNSGVYCFKIKDLVQSLKKLSNNNSQGEYYLTDVLSILIDNGQKVGAVRVENPSEILGINDRRQLAIASDLLRKNILNKHMKSGVTIIDPQTTYIDDEVEIGIDTIIYPGTILEGRTVIGEDCIIGPNTRITASKIDDNSEIVSSHVVDSSIASGTSVGPFAYIRPGSIIGSNVRIGDFVEIKNSIIGNRTKISHLTYVGDAEVGENVNLGCGVVFVNYNGKEKNKTVVGNNAFIGCNVNLVAPVEVKNNAYIAAGSTITDGVPENALAIARCRQVIKEDWVIKKGLRKKD